MAWLKGEWKYRIPGKSTHAERKIGVVVKERSDVVIIKDREGNAIVIDNLPTISCENCGVLLYSAKTLQMMDQIIDHPEHIQEKVVKFVELEVV